MTESNIYLAITLVLLAVQAYQWYRYEVLKASLIQTIVTLNLLIHATQGAVANLESKINGEKPEEEKTT